MFQLGQVLNLAFNDTRGNGCLCFPTSMQQGSHFEFFIFKKINNYIEISLKGVRL